MKKILCFLFIITLSGCTQFNASNSDDSPQLNTLTWIEHQQQIQQLSTWSLTGKLAVFLETERKSANLHWQQQGENYTIQLTSFIGTRILQITKSEQGVEIINDDGEIFTGQDASTLIKTLSPGLNLPISALQKWVKGDPADASYQLNDQQQVSDLLGKDGNSGLWAVNFQQYQLYSGYMLPRKLDLKRGDIRVKISINQWEINDK